MYVVSSRQTVLALPRIVEFATINRLPLAGGWGAWARSGGLLSYGPNVEDMARRTVTYIDQVALSLGLPWSSPLAQRDQLGTSNGRVLGVLDLDPVRGAPGLVRPITPPGDNALRPMTSKTRPDTHLIALTHRSGL